MYASLIITKLLKFVIIIFIVSHIVSCGGDSTTSISNTIFSPKITGTLTGNGLAENNWKDKILNLLFPSAYATTNSNPDSIVLIHNYGQSFKLIPVSVDGKFSIDTSDLSGTIVAFVVNTTFKTVFCHLND